MIPDWLLATVALIGAVMVVAGEFVPDRKKRRRFVLVGVGGFLAAGMAFVATIQQSNLEAQANKVRAEFDKRLLTKTEEQMATLKELAATNAELAALSSKIAEKNEEIANLNREIADVSKKGLAYATGAGSYFYLHVKRFGNVEPHAELVHVGQNPVRYTEVVCYDITEQMPAVLSGASRQYNFEIAPRRDTFVEFSYPGLPNRLTKALFETSPSNNYYTYMVHFSGPNGSYRQHIQFAKKGDRWLQAFRLERVQLNLSVKPIGEYFDEGFPVIPFRTFGPSPKIPDLDRVANLR